MFIGIHPGHWTYSRVFTHASADPCLIFIQDIFGLAAFASIDPSANTSSSASVSVSGLTTKDYESLVILPSFSLSFDHSNSER
jgi:hypothetical protein